MEFLSEISISANMLQIFFRPCFLLIIFELYRFDSRNLALNLHARDTLKVISNITNTYIHLGYNNIRFFGADRIRALFGNVFAEHVCKYKFEFTKIRNASQKQCEKKIYFMARSFRQR